MKKLSAIGFSAATYLSLALPAFAQTNVDPCPDDAFGGGVGFDILCKLNLGGGLVGSIITVFFVIAALIALAFLIYGGIRWITSGGDKTGVENARNTIVAALVGLVIVFLSFFIMNFLFGFFGLKNIQDLKLPSLSTSERECIAKGDLCGGSLGTNCCGSATCRKGPVVDRRSRCR